MSMKSKMRNAQKRANMPSASKMATVNRAGGVAFDISDPAVKLITMTGGSFFAEPKYYSTDDCVVSRDGEGKFSKLIQRISIADGKLKQLCGCDELDDVSREVIATVLDILNGDSPRDALAIAHWLRSEMNIRLTPQVILVMAGNHDALKNKSFGYYCGKSVGGRSLVRFYGPKIIQRPDEVKTCLMLHRFFFGQKVLPRALNFAICDALAKFDEYRLLKYDSPHFPTWKDVFQWVKRKNNWPVNGALARYFIRGDVSDDTPLVAARARLNKIKDGELSRKAKELISTGRMTWEEVLSWAGQCKINQKAVWEHLVDSNLIPYMATLRNMRNILQAGVSDATLAKVAKKVADPDGVRKGRQLPFRYAMAYQIMYQQIGQDMFDGRYTGYIGRHEYGVDAISKSQGVTIMLDAIEDAVDIACENIPAIPGHTAIFADNSGSMGSTVSEKSQVTCALAANIMCGMVAKRCEKATVAAFGTDVGPVLVRKRMSVIDVAKAVAKANTSGMATNGHLCLHYLMKNKMVPDRVILLSDMQCWNYGGFGNFGGRSGNVADEWKRFTTVGGGKNSWLHCIDLRGYGDSVVENGTKNVNLVGGFSEKIFSMLLEAEGVITKNDEEGKPALAIDQIRERF